MTMFDKIREMSLKSLDSAGLTVVLLEEARVNPESFSLEMVYKASAAATYLHAKQTRANRGNLPRTPYIEHPLRNAIRLVRWDCFDQDIIIAAILHDTVEDCDAKICRAEYGLNPKELTQAELRELAFKYVETEFGAEVKRLVAGVTNGFPPEGLTPEQKREYYAEHVRSVISDPGVFLVKFSDFVDNAAGLYHNDIEANHAKVAHLAAKYLPVIDIFEEAFARIKDQLPVSEAAKREIRRHLVDTRKRLTAIIARG